MSTSGFDILKISPRPGVIRLCECYTGSARFPPSTSLSRSRMIPPSRGRGVTIPAEQGKKRLSLRAERPYVQEDLDGRARLVPAGGWIGAMKDIRFTGCRVVDNKPAVSVRTPGKFLLVTHRSSTPSVSFLPFSVAWQRLGCKDRLRGGWSRWRTEGGRTRLTNLRHSTKT